MAFPKKKLKYYTNKIKTKRNKLLVELVDKGLSLQQVANALKLSAKSTVHEIYWREKRRSDIVK